MVRRVIEIDREKCNGCGACADACQEGAIGMADGKAEPIELKGQNVMYYELEGGTTFIIRPSGTEPKVKVYIMAKGENKAEAAEKVEALTTAAKEIVK